MVMAKNRRVSINERGFSLIELMVVMAVMVVIMGAVFKSIDLTQQKSASEAVKLDLTQQAREFMDQITRDLRSAGYPNSRNMTKNQPDAQYNGICAGAASNSMSCPNAPTNAPGLIFADYRHLWFAGDVDGTAYSVGGAGEGSAQVKIIKYDYVLAGVGCPCLTRTEYVRNSYQDPYTDALSTAATPQLEIQGVQNGTSWNDPIFTLYNSLTRTAITTAQDFTSGGSIPEVNSMQVVLAVQSQHQDSTKSYPITRVVSNIGISNCSEAMSGNVGC